MILATNLGLQTYVRPPSLFTQIFEESISAMKVIFLRCGDLYHLGRRSNVIRIFAKVGVERNVLENQVRCMEIRVECALLPWALFGVLNQKPSEYLGNQRSDTRRGSTHRDTSYQRDVQTSDEHR